MLSIPLPLCEDFLDPSHLAIGQPYLDTKRMTGRFGQNIFYNTPGQSPAALVLFQDDIDFNSGSYILPVFSIPRHSISCGSLFRPGGISYLHNEVSYKGKISIFN